MNASLLLVGCVLAVLPSQKPASMAYSKSLAQGTQVRGKKCPQKDTPKNQYSSECPGKKPKLAFKPKKSSPEEFP
jgi:hypothetical protein